MGCKLLIPMVRFLTVMILAAAAVAQSASPAPASPQKPAAIPEDENAAKARALVQKAIEALGGQAFLNWTNKSEEGRYYTFYHGEGRGAGVQYRNFTTFPDKDRFEIISRGNYLVPIPLVGVIVVTHEVKNKNDVVFIHDGDKGYEITYKGTAAEEAKNTAAFLRRRNHSLGWVLRKWINEPGVMYFYEGVAVAAQKPSERVTIMSANNESVTIFFDQNNFLPVKISYTWRDPDDKLKNDEEEVYDNYKEVQGIMTARSVTHFANGDMTVQRFLNNVVYNQALPGDLFAATISYDPYKLPAKH